MANELQMTRRSWMRSFYRGTVKTRAEAEVVLPDYKEDVHRILSLDAKPHLTSKEVYRDGQALFAAIRGSVAFDVIYLGENGEEAGTLSSFTLHSEFEHSIKIPLPEGAEPENFVMPVELLTENGVCKLLGPRKISVRCDVAASLSVLANDASYYYAKESLPGDLMIRENEIGAVRIFGHLEEDLSFSETIRLPREALPVEEILDANASFYPEEIKMEKEGVSVQGLCAIHCCYRAADPVPVSFYQPVEFSVLLQGEVPEENAFCQVSFAPNLLKFSVDSDESGENRVIRFEVAYAAEAVLYENEIKKAACDAFSTESLLKTNLAQSSFDTLLCMKDALIQTAFSFPAKDGILRAENAKARVDFQNSYLEDGKVMAEARLNYRYLGVREDQSLVQEEGAAEITLALPLDSEKIPGQDEARIEIEGTVADLDLSFSEGEVTAQAEVDCRMAVFQMQKKEYLAEIAVREAVPKEKKGVVFYYPETGETAWDVAKRYHISPVRLAEENDLPPDRLPGILRILIE